MTKSSLREKRKTKRFAESNNRRALDEAISKLSNLRRHGVKAKPLQVFVSEGAVIVRIKKEQAEEAQPMLMQNRAHKRSALLRQHQRALQRVLDAAKLDTENAVRTLSDESSEEAVAFYQSLGI
ncbi:hypothetical protein V4C85_20820 [Ralstonia solanacearum]|uniref:hypothetical protein n=1 Tax=Ralstonia solanacearum TaxID=305 RepID=UPI0012DA94AC|nr:hypothetical protein [Ralstonia solanacearum]